jgi:peptidoglycan/xylan/chitin deacetylase (PgdA/CDA1 family)
MTSKMTVRKLAILGFHKIGEPPSGSAASFWYISEAVFLNYLQCLQKYKWQVIDVKTFLKGLEAPDSLPERAALLTFDDGYKSIQKIALPLLRQFGYPAMLFVPTDYIGGYNDFDAPHELQEQICDWNDLKELDRWGISIQSHGTSHKRFSWIDMVEQEEELRLSKTLIESNIETPVEVFAFPYGDDGVNPREVAQILKRVGYRAACLYGGGPNSIPNADPYPLTRLAIGPDTNLQAVLK